jgi:hypothetical protein
MGGLLSFSQEEDHMVFTVSLPKTFQPELKKQQINTSSG